MWEQFSNVVMTYLDPIGVVVGLIIAIPVLWTWYEVAFGQRRRRRRLFQEMRAHPGQRPGILILDLLAGKDVSASVERFRQTDSALKEIPPERVLCLSRDSSLTPDDLPGVHDELRGLAARALINGIDVLHYYHAGPACVAAVVGGEFANTCRVILYQHDHGTYINFGPLKSL